MNNILLSNYKVIAFFETWLNSSVANGEFIGSRYTVYRRDRNHCTASKSDGGGVLIAVSRDISSTRIVNWESDCEDVWVNITV